MTDLEDFKLSEQPGSPDFTYSRNFPDIHFYAFLKVINKKGVVSFKKKKSFLLGDVPGY